MENKKFNYVILHFNPLTIENSEVINAHAVEDFFCDGIEEFSLEEARVDEILGERAYSGGDVPEELIDEVQAATRAEELVTYKYYFFEDDFEQNTKDFIEFVKVNFANIPVFNDHKEYEDWNAEWKKYYSPIYISENLEIIPEWQRNTYESKSKHQVYIYPGMGFGTGTHETTYLCMVLFDKLQKNLNEKLTCLDFGCGSGILGICAILLKAMTVTFCDIDKKALDNCLQNLVLNFEGRDLSGNQLVLRDRYEMAKHDVVFANILEHVLISEQKTIVDSLKANGYLIVSGLLNHQVDNIVKHYSFMEKLDVVSKGDWSAILFKSR